MAGRWSFERLVGVGLDPRDLDEVRALAVSDGHLQCDHDAVCPRCFRWIEDRDFVRRTAYGPFQHEVCPEPTLLSG